MSKHWELLPAGEGLSIISEGDTIKKGKDVGKVLLKKTLRDGNLAFQVDWGERGVSNEIFGLAKAVPVFIA